jgi:tetratricopeptide (TPR) repeat protein
VRFDACRRHRGRTREGMKRVWTIRPIAAAIMLGALSLSPVMVRGLAQGTESATQTLLDKARALEARGRMDMAAQTWQQVLLTDPKNVDALAGLARTAKLSGNETDASTYLDRLRAINPNDPNIERIQRMGSQQSQAAELQQAGKYAQSGQYEQAMTIYRKVFGNTPPPGDWALAYYETEAATTEGRPHAIAGLRALVDKYPNDSRYQIALGRILTYNPQTRAEGRRYLERHPDDPQAVEALRQSLVWDSSSPASAADIRAYLAKHNDAQLAQALKNMPKPSSTKPLTAEEVAAGQEAKARSEEEQAAYNSLNAKRLDDAEIRFKSILAKDPQNPQALAGMGYVRMQQSNFGAAMSFLEQAKQNGARDAGLDKALESARFFSVMSEGSVALSENDLPTAEQKYREALELRPGSTDALEGLGGTLLKAQQPEAAIPIYEEYTKAKPSAAAGWRGLFMAQYQAGNAPEALQTEKRIPAAVRSQLMKDPDFLRTLASAYSAVGRDADAQRVLRSALDLPFPTGARGLQIETQLQYAALLLQANRLDQAAALYKQVVTADPANVQGWQGVVRVEHAMKQDDQAVQALTSMPPSAYQVAMRDPGFQMTVASIYQSVNRLDVAQEILEKSIQQQSAAGQKPSNAVLLQLAGIYLSRNNAQLAFPIYRKILTEDPERADAWKGLLTILHATGRDQEALAQIQQIPASVRTQLESDVEYLQTVGAVYNALGQPQQAMVFINRVQQHYAMQHATPPADIDIQDAWLLFNGGNDAGLYRQLMLLGSRQDLSDEQRRSVQLIWSNWAVRRANQAASAGNSKRSLAILNAAAKAFPDNPGVLRALASGYARAGLPKQAVLIFKSQDMTSASASDYKAAVGAALAAGDMKSAETWLRYGLDQYPKDSEMLTLGAKFEQARGNSNRAADYFRASLAAMPPGDPGAELASELSQPAPAGRLPSATQSQDLASLLSMPDDVASGSQNVPAPPPYLPSYTNVYGQAPVQVPGPNPGRSSIVPLYMANPAARHSTTPLGDYTPDTTASVAAPTGSVLPATAATSSTAPPAEEIASASTLDYQRQQIQRLTEQAEATPPITTSPQQDAYGPYVPYSPVTQNAGYTPSAVSVQLGDSTPHQEPAQREMTDVLPAVRYVPNAGAGSRGANRPMTGVSTPPPDDTINSPATQNVQYTAQAQPQQQSGDSFGQQYPQPGIAPYKQSTTKRRTSRAPARTTTTQSSPPPLSYPGVQRPLGDSGYPVIGPGLPQGTPPTDADLMAKSLPPLRGGYDANAVVPGGPLSPRAQNELELASLEGSYSGWIGGTGYARYRSGTPGFDQLTDIEAPFEASGVLGKTLRATVIARPVFLNSGVVNTTAFQNQSGGTIPVLGTLPGNALTTPPQQFSTGVGGEFQLTSANLGLAVGYTPYQFLVSNVTARFQWRPAGGHFTFFGDRDSVKDTQLSYAGLRDPGTISAIYQGNIWGGVIATGGGVRLDIGNEKSGLYVSGDGADLTGYHVLENRKYEGQMGSYFRVKTFPGYGSLNIGASFFGMHYDYNERGMTYGQGGYFSPNVYFLASVPVSFNGYYKTDFHYSINGAVGVQTFQEASAPYYPLDRPLQTGSGNAMFPQNSNTGLNYSLNAEGAYRFADHWYVGAYVDANNTNNYNMISGGFFVRYLFKPQYPTESYPTGLFPTSGSSFRPIRVP